MFTTYFQVFAVGLGALLQRLLAHVQRVSFHFHIQGVQLHVHFAH